MESIGIIHYDEIALKGGNRKIFEDTLVRNVRQKIKHRDLPLEVVNTWGRILLVPKENAEWKETYDQDLRTILSETPGVSVFGFGVVTTRDEEGMKKAVLHLAESKADTFETFRVTTTRLDKTYPDTSPEIDKRVGGYVYEFFNGTKKVQLKKADANIRIEILETKIYVYIKEKGISGLPVGSSGNAVALLSGGFDSPVATYMCATRGVTPLLMHFHAYPQTSRAAIEKVEDLAKVLSDVCGPLKLAMVPLLDAQKEIALVAPEKLRVILYRRLMMRVAEEWGKKHKAKALITGESVGQVASQTLENMGAVENATTLPVLRPLAGMNKQEIIDRARVIGTHDISVLPHDDTCTVFMPKHPETKAKLEDVLAAEALYDSSKLVADMIQKIEVQIV